MWADKGRLSFRRDVRACERYHVDVVEGVGCADEGERLSIRVLDRTIFVERWTVAKVEIFHFGTTGAF